MNARNLGFMSSWHMLTRDKGWIKPVLVLTLLGMVPFLGQICLMGYGLEWARLTAWGVESAPKQRGVDYGKVLSTGGRAFLITLLMSMALGILLSVFIPGSAGVFAARGLGYGAVSDVAMLTTSGALSFIGWVVGVLSGTFINAACMRATIYDGFAAGWRVDRIFQMISRDFAGFLKTWLVAFIGSLATGLFTGVIALVCAVIFGIGALSTVSFAGLASSQSNMDYFVRQLVHIGVGPVLVFVVLVIAAVFVGSVINTAMQLLIYNAVGQWFCRFEVGTWGPSEAPLPEGVPHKNAEWTGTAPTNPTAGFTPSEAARPVEPVMPLAPAAPAKEQAQAETPEHEHAKAEEEVGKTAIPLGPISTDNSAEDGVEEASNNTNE